MKPGYRSAALPFLAAGLGLAVSCFAAPPPAQARTTRLVDSNALIMTAEIELKRDDCGRASADFTEAAQQAKDPKLAQRATDVSLDCGEYQAAQRAAARWRELTPAKPAPRLAAMRAALGLYRIQDARSEFEAWLKAGGVPAGHPIGDALEQVAQQSGANVTLEMLKGVRTPVLQSAAGQLALANLALEDFNDSAAVSYGQRALANGGNHATVQWVLARAYVGLGLGERALAAAKAAQAAAPAAQRFAVADVLMLLGRNDEAHSALEALAAERKPAVRVPALRRLGLLAFERGNYGQARQYFSKVLDDRRSMAIAVYYLAAIAERRGHLATAVRGYQLLGGTPLESVARERIAHILYKQHDRSDALALLAPDHKAAPSARLAAELAQAELLSDGGEADAALARINDALARFPSHPDLLYQRAIVLDHAHHTNAAISQLERLHRERPQDANVSNALGYVLADHDRELPRAEGLIRSALRAQPENPAFLDSLGWVEFRMGHAHQALPLLEHAFQLDHDGDIGAHWGEVLWSLGEKTRAQRAWSRALLADPGNALVKTFKRRAGLPTVELTGPGVSI